jgi:putative hydrolase of the HAD superfamily
MIILDIDDTLIDHSNAARVASIKFGSQFNDQIPDYEEGDIVQIWQEEAKKHFKSYLAGDYDFQEQRRRRIRGIFQDESIPDSQADELFDFFLKEYEDAWELFSDVIPFLETNHHRGLAVLSDGSQSQQEKKLKKTGIYRYFDFVITAESEGLSKPDPAFFLRACDIARKDPSAVIYVGDHLRKDALGAFQAGLNGVWINRSKEPTQEEIYAVECLTDLVPEEALQWTLTLRKSRSLQ